MNINRKNAEQILGVDSTDYNQGWVNKTYNPLVHDDDSIIQAINNIIFLNINDIYYGGQNELALENSIFEPIEFMGDEDALNDIKTKLFKLDPRINLITKSSSISTPADGEYFLDLAFQIEDRTRNLTRRVKIK